MAADGVARGRPATARPPARDGEAIRAVILEAAEFEFCAHGFQGASVQAIADRAGLPKANVHYWFGSKARIYRTLLDATVERWNRFLEGVTAEDDPAEVLERFVREKVRMARTHPRASRLFAMEIIQGAPHLQDFLGGELRAWLRDKAAVIDAWIAAGRMDPVDPVLLIFTLWSITQHYADFEAQVLTLLNRREYDEEMIEEIGDFLTRLVLRGCGVRPASATGAQGVAAGG